MAANIIGISGTDASGKDTVGQMLAERHNWLFVSVSEILRDELRQRNVPLERKNLRELSAQWRRQHGLGVLVDKAVQQFHRSGGRHKYQGLVIASLRHPGEAARLQELGGRVVWTDADPKVRYRRIVARNRGTEDQVSFDEFLAEEQAQMKPSGDEATLSLSGVKERADIFIVNDGNDTEAFKNQAEKKLAKFIN